MQYLQLNDGYIEIKIVYCLFQNLKFYKQGLYYDMWILNDVLKHTNTDWGLQQCARVSTGIRFPWQP